jgi:hypothetical protein
MSHKTQDSSSSAGLVATHTGVAILKAAGSLLAPVGIAVALGEEAIKVARGLKVDMEQVQLAAVADEVERLHAQLARVETRVTEPVEVLEIALNVLGSYPSILRREKRRQLTNALVNGVANEPWNAELTRHFVRAVITLEPEHVHTLIKYASETILLPNGSFTAPDGTLEAAYLYQLHSWQFLGTPRHADAPGRFEVTRLGVEFLAHLWDSEAGDNPYVLWPSVIDLRDDASMPIYSGFWPELRNLRRFEIADREVFLIAEHKDGYDVRMTAAEIRARAEKWRSAPRY